MEYNATHLIAKLIIINHNIIINEVYDINDFIIYYKILKIETYLLN